jgi:hypothetical protein
MPTKTKQKSAPTTTPTKKKSMQQQAKLAEAPLAMLIDMFPGVNRSHLQSVLQQNKNDVQAATEQLIVVDLDALPKEMEEHEEEMNEEMMEQEKPAVAPERTPEKVQKSRHVHLRSTAPSHLQARRRTEPKVQLSVAPSSSVSSQSSSSISPMDAKVRAIAQIFPDMPVRDILTLID